jgi:hypothetical protein
MLLGSKERQEKRREMPVAGRKAKGRSRLVVEKLLAWIEPLQLHNGDEAEESRHVVGIEGRRGLEDPEGKRKIQSRCRVRSRNYRIQGTTDIEWMS